MPPTPETRAMVLLAAQICEDKKGTDTRILELDPADAGFTDFFLITSGSNSRQTGAIADEIELRLKRDFGVYAKSVEGRRSGEWILLDYIDFVVHVFTEQTREFYDIERLRKSARSVASHELAAELNRKTEAARKKAPAKRAAFGDGEHALARLGRAEIEERRPAKKAAKKAPGKKAAKKAAAKSPAKKAPGKKAAKESLKKSPGKKAAKRPEKVADRSAQVEDLSLRALPAGRSRKGLPAPGE